jgi:phosphoribosylformimino-5-aminoimidazole carboxamide ribotide isomerase
MIIFPAIDLRKGRVVRLQQGRADAETEYGDDPAQTAAKWQSQGAEWLHVVNLDGAFGDDASANLRELARIVGSVSVPVQFGGGLRDIASIEKAYSMSVTRIILGTAAIERPALVAEAIARFGAERVVVGIDARGGVAATHGWRDESPIRATDLARQMCEQGVTRIVYTDIARDGMMGGVDAQGIAQLGRETGLRIIASGGVANMTDITALSTYPEIEGVVVGKALYTGAVNLREAIDAGKKNYSMS